MRTFGWVFLVFYALDACLSAFASYEPSVLFVSNLVSAAMILVAIVGFVLACIGKLLPRKVFLVLSVYYFLILVFSIGLGVLLVAQLGPQKLQGVHVTPQFYREQFAWFEPAHVGILVVWVCLAVYGFVLFGMKNSDTQDVGARQTS